MVPKVIHYCWFGRKPLPPFALKCIESWKKCLPDYEIKEWNEDNFDVNMILYTKEAYEAKKYAFVSDYARFWILYKFGGLYFDTDVEVIKPMNDIIARGAFMGCENEAQVGATALAVAPGLGLGCNPGLGLGCNPGLGLGCNPGLPFYKEMLDLYSTLHFIKPNGSYNQKTIVAYTTEMLCKYGLRNTNDIQECANIWIYPREYFCPLDYHTNVMTITDNTYTIHHYAATWITSSQKLYKIVENLIGRKLAQLISRTLKNLHLAK